MQCTTKRLDPTTQLLIDVPKRAFLTLELAIAHCKKINSTPGRIHKIVSYKCGICHKFHTGRNGKEISKKDADKWTKAITTKGIKIIGKIDLNENKT